MQQEAQQKSGGQEQEPFGPFAVSPEQKPQSPSSVQGINGQHIPGGEQRGAEGQPGAFFPQKHRKKAENRPGQKAAVC